MFTSMKGSRLGFLTLCLALALAGIFVGCSGGGGSTPTPPADPRPIVTGTVQLPAGNPDELTIQAGINKPVAISGGSFGVRLFDNAPAVITAVDKSGAPVLMSFSLAISRSKGYRSRAVESQGLSPESTAIALVYLVPTIAQNSPDLQEAVKSKIASLPETLKLANAIRNSLQQNQGMSPLSDPTVSLAYTSAVQAMITTMDQTQAQLSRGITISPSQASGIGMNVWEEDSAIKGVTVRNIYGRWVSVVPDNEDSKIVGPCELIFMGFPQPKTDNIPVRFSDENMAIKVYGIGHQIPPSGTEDRKLWAPIAGLTVVEQWLVPIADSILNIAFPADRGILAELSISFANSYAMVETIDCMAVGNYSGMMLCIGDWLVTENADRIFEAFICATAQLAVDAMLYSGCPPAAAAEKTALMIKAIYTISKNGAIVSKSIRDIYNCKSVETFTVTVPTGGINAVVD